MLLPVVVCLAVGLAAALVDAIRRAAPAPRRYLLGLAAGAVAWLAGSSGYVWPHALCYTNELWGGTAQGYLCLSDSNYDWGQGLQDLSRWQHDHDSGPLPILYWGTDPAAQRPPFRPVSLLELPRRLEDVPRVWPGRRLAVGVTLMHGPVLAPAQLERLATFLRGCRPVDRTPTFIIYELGPPPPPGPAGRGPSAARGAREEGPPASLPGPLRR
jgi:hypothetical protein